MREQHILDVNPEGAKLFEPFDSLYRKARQDFCFRLSQAVDVHFSKMLLEREDAALGNAIDRMINDTAHAVVPSGDMVEEYIEANPGIVEPHEDQEWVTGKKPEGPLESAYINLFLWVYGGLYRFWQTRLEGDMSIIVTVTRSGISLKGVLPEDVTEVLYRADGSAATASPLDTRHESDYDIPQQRSALHAKEASNPPF